MYTGDPNKWDNHFSELFKIRKQLGPLQQIQDDYGFSTFLSQDYPQFDAANTLMRARERVSGVHDVLGSSGFEKYHSDAMNLFAIQELIPDFDKFGLASHTLSKFPASALEGMPTVPSILAAQDAALRYEDLFTNSLGLYGITSANNVAAYALEANNWTRATQLLDSYGVAGVVRASTAILDNPTLADLLRGIDLDDLYNEGEDSPDQDAEFAYSVIEASKDPAIQATLQWLDGLTISDLRKVVNFLDVVATVYSGCVGAAAVLGVDYFGEANTLDNALDIYAALRLIVFVSHGKLNQILPTNSFPSSESKKRLLHAPGYDAKSRVRRGGRNPHSRPRRY